MLNLFIRRLNKAVNDPNPARKIKEVIKDERNMLMFSAGLYDNEGEVKNETIISKRN